MDYSFDEIVNILIFGFLAKYLEKIYVGIYDDSIISPRSMKDSFFYLSFLMIVPGCEKDASTAWFIL